jgi:hypothetical protein
MWATPNPPARGEDSRASKALRGSGGIDLQTQSAQWPTPDANCHKGSTKPGQRVGQLDEAAEAIWQPCLSSRPAPPTPDGQTSSPARRRLNPQFVAWLMGWPALGASGFAFSETEWSHYRLRLLSAHCGMQWKETGDDDATLFA